MVKKLQKDVLDLTGATVITSVGAGVITNVGGSAAPMSAMAGYFTPIANISGLKAVTRGLKKVKW